VRVGSGLGWLGVGFAADYFKRPERRKEPKARFLVSGTKRLQQENDCHPDTKRQGDRQLLSAARWDDMCRHAEGGIRGGNRLICRRTN